MFKMISVIDNIHKNTRYRIKDLEKAQIYQTINLNPGITRKNIFQKLNMRPTTVSNNVSELIEQDMVYEGSVVNNGKKGRPEKSLHANYNHFVCIAVHLSSNQLKAALVNIQGDILKDTYVVVPPTIDNDALFAAFLEIINPLKKAKHQESQLQGIGISFSGFINKIDKELVHIARWNNISRFSFKKLADRLECEVIAVHILESELAHLLLEKEEYRIGSTLVYHWGYGIGACYSLNGQIIKSTTGYVMEVGHITSNINSNNKCKCGNYGCLEGEASIGALLPSLAHDPSDIPEEEIAFKSFLIKKDLYKSPIIQQATKCIALNLATIYKVLFPDRIILISPFFDDQRVFGYFKEYFRKMIPSFARNEVKLITIDLENRSEVYGCIYNLFRKHLRKSLIVRN